jgi:hypothetical protein
MVPVYAVGLHNEAVSCGTRPRNISCAQRVLSTLILKRLLARPSQVLSAPYILQADVSCAVKQLWSSPFALVAAASKRPALLSRRYVLVSWTLLMTTVAGTTPNEPTHGLESCLRSQQSLRYSGISKYSMETMFIIVLTRVRQRSLP